MCDPDIDLIGATLLKRMEEVDCDVKVNFTQVREGSAIYKFADGSEEV